jgi:hypothetical protein
MALIAAIIFLVFRLARDDYDIHNISLILAPPAGGDGRGILATPDNIDAIRNATPDDTFYTASMSIEWDFEAWNVPSPNAFVENSEMNSRTVYFNVYLNEDGDKGEVIFKSPYMPVGTRFERFSLDEELPKGTYEVFVTYYLVDSRFTIVANVTVEILINIHG